MDRLTPDVAAIAVFVAATALAYAALLGIENVIFRRRRREPIATTPSSRQPDDPGAPSPLSPKETLCVSKAGEGPGVRAPRRRAF